MILWYMCQYICNTWTFMQYIAVHVYSRTCIVWYIVIKLRCILLWIEIYYNIMEMYACICIMYQNTYLSYLFYWTNAKDVLSPHKHTCTSLTRVTCTYMYINFNQAIPYETATEYVVAPFPPKSCILLNCHVRSMWSCEDLCFGGQIGANIHACTCKSFWLRLTCSNYVQLE